MVINNSCEKPEDLTATTDITKFSWNLKLLKEGHKNIKLEDIYLLELLNDSLFNLNLSVNGAGGKYKILSKGEVIIYNFQPFTEICCENDFDKKLITILPTITTYQVLNNTLIFKGDNVKVEFEKQ